MIRIDQGEWFYPNGASGVRPILVNPNLIQMVHLSGDVRGVYELQFTATGSRGYGSPVVFVSKEAAIRIFGTQMIEDLTPKPVEAQGTTK